MKPCPWCGRDIDERVTACPYWDCARVVTPEAPSSFGEKAPSGGGPASGGEMPLPSPPPPPGVAGGEPPRHGPPAPGSRGGEMPLPSPPPPPGVAGGEPPRHGPPAPGSRGGEMPLPSPPPPGVARGELPVRSAPKPPAASPDHASPGSALHGNSAGSAYGRSEPSIAPADLTGAASWAAIARVMHWLHQLRPVERDVPEPPMPAPPQVAKSDTADPAEFAASTDAVPAEAICLRVEAEDLSRRLRYGQRRRAALTTAVVAIVTFGVLSWVTHSLHRVMNYATLAPEITLRPDPTDPDRVIFRYRPLSSGRLAFRRIGAERQTELLDEVSAAAVGHSQILIWKTENLRDGDRFSVRHLDGWRLATEELTISRGNSDP